MDIFLFYSKKKKKYNKNCHQKPEQSKHKVDRPEFVIASHILLCIYVVPTNI